MGIPSFFLPLRPRQLCSKRLQTRNSELASCEPDLGCLLKTSWTRFYSAQKKYHLNSGGSEWLRQLTATASIADTATSSTKVATSRKAYTANLPCHSLPIIQVMKSARVVLAQNKASTVGMRKRPAQQPAGGEHDNTLQILRIIQNRQGGSSLNYRWDTVGQPFDLPFSPSFGLMFH